MNRSGLSGFDRATVVPMNAPVRLKHASATHGMPPSPSLRAGLLDHPVLLQTRAQPFLGPPSLACFRNGFNPFQAHLVLLHVRIQAHLDHEQQPVVVERLGPRHAQQAGASQVALQPCGGAACGDGTPVKRAEQLQKLPTLTAAQSSLGVHPQPPTRPPRARCPQVPPPPPQWLTRSAHSANIVGPDSGDAPIPVCLVGSTIEPSGGGGGAGGAGLQRGGGGGGQGMWAVWWAACSGGAGGAGEQAPSLGGGGGRQGMRALWRSAGSGGAGGAGLQARSLGGRCGRARARAV